MSGAYTAVADGPEGAFYNPAGLVFTSSRYLSLSTNAIQFKRSDYQNIWPSSSRQIDYLRDSFSFLPNFFGIIQKNGNFAFAFTMISLDNEQSDQRDRVVLPFGNNADEVLNVNYNYLTSHNEIGPSFSYLLGDRFSFGWSLFFGYRDSKYITQNVNQYYDKTTVDGSLGDQKEYFAITSYYLRNQILSLRPQFGLQYMVLSNLSFGLVSSIPVPLYGLYNFQSTSFEYNGESGTWDFYDEGSVDVVDNNRSTRNIFSDRLFENFRR